MSHEDKEGLTAGIAAAKSKRDLSDFKNELSARLKADDKDPKESVRQLLQDQARIQGSQAGKPFPVTHEIIALMEHIKSEFAQHPGLTELLGVIIEENSNLVSLLPPALCTRIIESLAHDKQLAILNASPDIINILTDKNLEACLQSNPQLAKNLSPNKQLDLVIKNPEFITYIDSTLKKDRNFLKSLLASNQETFKKLYQDTKPFKDLMSIIKENSLGDKKNALGLEIALSYEHDKIFQFTISDKNLELLSKLSKLFLKPIKPDIVKLLPNQNLVSLLDRQVITLQQIPEDKFNEPQFVSMLSTKPELLELALTSLSEPIKRNIVQLLEAQQLISLLDRQVITLQQIPADKFNEPKFVLEVHSAYKEDPQLVIKAFQNQPKVLANLVCYQYLQVASISAFLTILPEELSHPIHTGPTPRKY